LSIVVTFLVWGMFTNWRLCIPAGFFYLILLLFHSLTVEVDDWSIRLRFGVGMIRRTIPLEKVVLCQTIRNHWFLGWGIRYVFNGWMWNVSGFDAVELTYTNGRHFRIGTDEPRALEAAINRALASSEDARAARVPS
jgi:hypothetical protein